MNRRGLSLTEVVVALLAFAVAVVPLMQSGTSIHRQSYMGELHVMGAMRARTLLGLVQTMDFDALCRLLGRQPTPAPVVINVEDLFPPGEVAFALSAPSSVDAAYASKLKLFSHEVSGRILDRHRVEVVASVRWTLVSDKADKKHEHRAAVILHRPEVTTSKGVTP